MRKPISVALALLGLFDSLYLLWTYTLTKPIMCFGGGCDAVRNSPYAHMGGLPMPVLGVAGYVLIVLLIVAESLVPASLAIEIRYALAGATAFGFLFSVYLEYLQGFVIHAFCTWCVTSGVVMMLLFALALYNVSRPGPEADPPAQIVQLRSYFAVGVLAILIGVPAFYELATHGETAPPPPPAATETTAAKLVRPDSHVTNNPDAPVTVVEFGDLECPVCGSEQEVVHAIRAKYGNQIRFVFRQFPLTHIHPFSERMAEASECAGEQGRFWEAIDKIYSRQSDTTTDEALRRDVTETGVDMSKFDQCMSSGAEMARVNRDHEDGVALGVVGTPTFYVDRESVPDVPTFDDLSKVIDQHLMMAGEQSPSSATPARPPTASVNTPPAAEKNSTASPGSGKSSPAPAESASPSLDLGQPPGGLLSSFQTGGGQVCSEAEAAMKQPTLIDSNQLRAILSENTKPLFVDVRPAKEFAAGKIPGAINIPLDEMPQRWGTLPKDRTLIFYEAGTSGDICASARAAGRTVLEHGYPYSQVKVYQEGLAGWKKSGLGSTK